MFNKALVKIIAVLAALSMALTVTLVAYGEGEQGGDQTSSVASVSSSAASSEAASNVSSEAASISSTPETSSEQTPLESDVTSSEIVSSDIATSEVVSVESTVESVSSKTSSTSSKKKKPSSDKGKTSKVNKTEGEQSQVTNYYTPSYDAGSMSEKWEGEHTELEETSSVRELSKHLINPKKELLKWIWVPVLVALLCIGALIYINVYVYGKKNSKLKKGEDGFIYAIGDDFIYLDETDVSDDDEAEEEENDGVEEDPFSAENFFNFDNE